MRNKWIFSDCSPLFLLRKVRKLFYAINKVQLKFSTLINLFLGFSYVFYENDLEKKKVDSRDLSNYWKRIEMELWILWV
jgi:hypothetical protein